MQWWMILAIEFPLLGIGGILTDIRLSKRSGRMLIECPHDTEVQATKNLSGKG